MKGSIKYEFCANLMSGKIPLKLNSKMHSISQITGFFEKLKLRYSFLMGVVGLTSSDMLKYE